jgi:CheY-like chemotaxis protein/HPt (histidine-containing phosphotransfer) domain-containing protein
MASKPATSPKPPRGARRPSPSGTAFCRREGCAWGFAGLWSASMSVSPLFARRRRWTASPRSDVALALALGVVCLQSAFGADGLERPAWAVVLLIELSVLPLAVRRSHPLAVLATMPGPVIALSAGSRQTTHRRRSPRPTMQMPDMDGLSLAREIRLLRDARAVPLLLVTSLGRRTEDREAGVEFAAVLTKPIKASQLLEALMAVFGDGVEPVLAQRTDEPLGADDEKRPSPRILVAEDNEVNQKLTLLVLEKMGYRADVAVNGLEALEALRRKRYDIVLMDVEMPWMDGLEASRRIHREWTGKDRPRIIAMTANAMQGDRDTCLNAGMDDYLSRPIHADELASALGRAIPPRAVQEMRDTDVLDDSALEHLDVATGDPAFVADLVDTFLREAPVLVAGLKTARQSGDAEEGRRAAHTLKSNARTFGAAGLANLRQELENTAKRQVMSEAAGLVTNIDDEYARVASALATAREERRRA